MTSFKPYLSTAAIASILALTLQACESGGVSVDNNGPIAPGAPIVANDFTFPTIDNLNGDFSIKPQYGTVPVFSTRRKIASGSGSIIQFGDPVVIDFQVFSWKTGKLVDSSEKYNEPITLRAGVIGGAPEYLTKSLLGRNIGDIMQIVFAAGMEDLPTYLDKNDAYVVVVKLI